MSIRLLNLRSVPEDEAEEIRELLTEKGFDFYETPAGRWGISSPGLWLRDESQLEEAKSALSVYQAERYQRITSEYEELKRQGLQRRLSDIILESPLRFVFYISVIALILYFSVAPFMNFAG